MALQEHCYCSEDYLPRFRESNKMDNTLLNLIKSDLTDRELAILLLENTALVNTANVVPAFLEKYPNLVYARDRAGNTPLHVVKTGPSDRELITLFLHSGALVNTVNALGETPLHCAAKDEWPEERMKMLLKYGADVYALTLEGNSALHIAATLSNKYITYHCLRDSHN